jgi:hypothetical protein
MSSRSSVPNRGRHRPPTTFGPAILSTDYVGHSIRKSAGCEGRGLRQGLVRVPIGEPPWQSSTAMADAILQPSMAIGPSGWCFPTIRTPRLDCQPGRCRAALRGWVLGRCHPTNFPIGTMFWARTSALAPFVNLNLQWVTIPRSHYPMTEPCSTRSRGSPADALPPRLHAGATSV